VKLLMLTANNWSNCTVLCVKKGRIIGKDITSSFLHDNAPSHTSIMVQNWRYSTGKCYPILLTRPGTFWLSPVFVDEPRVRWAAFRFLWRRPKRRLEWFASKDEEFFWRSIHKLPERWEKCIVSEGKYFE